MKILILGGGGREHAIAVRLSQSHSVSEIHAAPGNDGMRRVAICHDWSWKDSDKLIEFCVRTEIDVVVIGPEDPLVHGRQRKA
jgi:phosphoribosylamine---glycine ligase